MNHRLYYQFQAKARGVLNAEAVRRIAREKSYLYDRILLPWLPGDKTSPISELACGHGSLLCWLAGHRFSSIVGIDSSAEQIALAREAGAVVEQADVNEWLGAQPNTSLQAIIAIDLIEHMDRDAFMDLLSHSRRVLRPGGGLLLRCPNGDSPLVGMNLFNDITHVWTYTPNCLNSLAQMHGFTATAFKDEGCDGLRDARWFKVPLCRVSAAVLKALLRAATREKVQFLSPHLWARLGA